MSDFDIILEDAFDIKGEPAILIKISSEVALVITKNIL